MFGGGEFFYKEMLLLHHSGGSSSVGRASASQAEGRGSESRFPLNEKVVRKDGLHFFWKKG